MNHSLLIKSEAGRDISDACAWYESERAGLGKSFAEACDRACERVLFDPESFAAVVASIRWVPLKRFPHGVFFQVETDRVVVLAVLHGRRSLKTLAERLKSGLALLAGLLSGRTHPGEKSGFRKSRTSRCLTAWYATQTRNGLKHDRR